MTKLDGTLQQIAGKDWPRFVALVGEDAIIAAKICLLRGQNKSYTEISIKLGITEKKARYWCSDCGRKIQNEEDV